MTVLIILFIALLLARLCGSAGVEYLNSWTSATRRGLAVMFPFTAAAYFNAMRHALVRMVPHGVPRPTLAIYLTGFCEIAGAAGLLIPATCLIAATAIILFLLAVLPANIHAVRDGVPLRGRPATPLALRIPMQILFIVLTWWSGINCRT